MAALAPTLWADTRRLALAGRLVSPSPGVAVTSSVAEALDDCHIILMSRAFSDSVDQLLAKQLTAGDLQAMLAQPWPLNPMWLELIDDHRMGWMAHKHDEDALSLVVVTVVDGRTLVSPVMWEQGHATSPDQSPEIAEAHAAAVIATAATMGTPDVSIERQAGHPPSVRAKRERKGKRTYPDYHILDWSRALRRDYTEGTGSGTKHSYRYAVRGHWRLLKSGRLTWVRPHFRGPEGEESPNTRVYRV